MVKNRTIICLVSALIIVFVVAGVTTSAKASEKLKIGAIWGLSGPGSQLQVIMRDASVLAVEWLNKKGGIKVSGQQYDVELLVEDNKNTADGSAAAATKLVYRDKVRFVTGMIVPFQINAVETITEPSGVILASGKAAYLNPNSRLSFSATASIVAPLPGLYEALVKWYPGVKTVAFTAHDEAGAQAVLKAAREIAQAHGLKLQDPILTIFGTKDYYPTWTKALKDKPDAVDVGVGFSDAISANIRQGRELGFKGPVLTPNTGEVATFVNLIGKEAADDVLCAVFDPGAPDTPAMTKEIARL
jgi:branched-chain amino acid transport system substrate-binding protein